MYDSYLEERGREILQLLYENPDAPIAVDTETTGLRITGVDHCIGVSLAGVVGTQSVSHYFGVNHENGVNCDPDTVQRLEYVISQGRPLIFANVQFDILSVETISGLQLDNMPFYDICTMANYVNENVPKSKSLESLGAHYADVHKVFDPFIEQEKKTGNRTVTPEQMFHYGRVDAENTYLVWDQLMQMPDWMALPEYIWPDKQDLIRVLLSMRRHGVRIDKALAWEYVVEGEAIMKKVAAELGYPARPTKSNPDPLPILGPKALKELFIDRLGLPVVKKSKPSARFPKGQISFDKEAMEIYDEMLEKTEGPEAKLVKEYRGWQKAVSSSYRPYIELCDPDGRLRTSYKTHGTVTGRLSSAEPNLQQIPKSSTKQWNGKVKECFIPDEGYVLINADFSQLELRLGTAYAGEESLRVVFEEGRDIFTEMSVQIGMNRQDTKTLVYTMQYGGGERRVKQVFGVSQQDARKIRANYHETYPRFRVLSDRIAAAVERTMRARIWTGRYRHFEYKSEAYKAMNSVIQGGAADLMERCMVYVHRKLESDDCRILLQVHDSLLFEVRIEMLDKYWSMIRELMEDVPAYVGHNDFNVKFAVEVDYWSEREKVKYDTVS